MCDKKEKIESMLDDESMEKVTGGTEEFTFSDFFEDEGFDKEFVYDSIKESL